MTTDDSTTALQERIAEELYYGQHPEGRHRSEWPAAVYPEDTYEYRDLAAVVLPIITAEVRKAQAEALRETADWWAANPDADVFETDGDTRNWLRDVAEEYETGGQA